MAGITSEVARNMTSLGGDPSLYNAIRLSFSDGYQNGGFADVTCTIEYTRDFENHPPEPYCWMQD